ncbi:hypothetical protein HDV01_007283 [Terramyces sp. JEL0728]|nr:hypothetical protein HDV01_007283 [Terramyces sp. JEL0728]
MSIKKPELKTKLPLNGFFLYKREIRDFLKAEYGVSKSHEINALAAKRWALEPPSIKNKYSLLSREQFRQHKLITEASLTLKIPPAKLKAEPLYEHSEELIKQPANLTESVSLKLPKFNSPNLHPQFQLMNGFHQNVFIDLACVYVNPNAWNNPGFAIQQPFLNFQGSFFQQSPGNSDIFSSILF